MRETQRNILQYKVSRIQTAYLRIDIQLALLKRSTTIDLFILVKHNLTSKTRISPSSKKESYATLESFSLICENELF